MATYTSNYAWTKPSGGDPVDIEVLNDNLDDQDRIVHQAFLDLAPVFSTANTYAVKDVVLYDNKVWICHTAVTTAGAWTGSTNWTQTTVGETGGVATYADLPDKPSINGNELSGNKTGAQLGLQNALTFDNVPTANSNNPVKSGGVYSADEAIRKWTTAEAKSVSGNPITLNDGSARKAEGLAVTCNPKQNLHGYDHPWAGGAGKNKLEIPDVNTTNVKSIKDSDGNVIAISFIGQTPNPSNHVVLKRGLKLKAGTYYAKNILYSGSAVGNKPLLVIEIPNSSSILLVPNRDTTFTLDEDTTLGNIYINFGDGEGLTTDFAVQPFIILNSETDATFEPYSNECPITGYTECVVDVCVVDDGYETTQATAAIAFGQTVYGGTVNFKTGKATLTHAIREFDGDEYWRSGTSVGSNFRAAFNMNDVVQTGQVNAISNELEYLNDYSLDAPHFYIYNGKLYVFLPASNETDFKAWLASNPLQVCYELATPTELTLTPAELELLKGYNYISTNGTTISLDYLPDSLLAEAENYVDAKIPPAPTTDGTYVLTCTVTDGTPAYSWESAT